MIFVNLGFKHLLGAFFLKMFGTQDRLVDFRKLSALVGNLIGENVLYENDTININSLAIKLYESNTRLNILKLHIQICEFVQGIKFIVLISSSNLTSP